MTRTKTVRIVVVCAALAWAPFAGALESDRQQPMNIDANYQKSTQSQSGNSNDPDITNLDGNVKITQGSLKSHGDHAVIYKNPSGVADESGNIGGIRRLVLTGKPAHMEQIHDVDCNPMSADALKIDYNNITGIAVLTSNVVVVQKGKSEFHGENMIYNTNTGEMESGDKSPNSRIHIVMEPKAAAAAPATTNNCGFPGTQKTKSDKSVGKSATKP